LAALLQSLIFHFFFATGTLAEHLFQLLGLTRSESTLSERRQALSWSLFAELLRQSLRPLAERPTHKQAFWRHWRLVAWDGTRFSLTNTPQILTGLRKAKSRRKRAAWAKMTAVVLLELGLHNPLAAAIGWQGESEYALTRTLLGCLPPAALLLADRLCGCGLILAEISAACRQVGSHFLIRSRTDIKVRTLYSLPDGSAIVELRIRDPKHRKKILYTLRLREIRVRIRGRGGKSCLLRLWTSLLDPKSAPALELGQLYAQRWEQELYWRQMKLELRKSSLLQSHTPETAAQEVAALVLATALLAHERSRIAAGQAPVLDISFVKCLNLLRPLWLVLCLAKELLSPRQKAELASRFDELILASRKPARRNRSCERAVRQPVKSWPRLLTPRYARGEWSYEIVQNTA
jgi:hypothetical protein